MNTPRIDEQDDNARARPSGTELSQQAAEPVSRLGPSGFDPSRCRDVAQELEYAQGGERALDAAIFNVASEQMERWNRVAIQLPLDKRRSRYDDGWVHVYAGKGLEDKYPEDLPRYTSSLDDALTLLPGRDWEWSLEWETGSDGKMFARFALGDPMRFTDWEAKTEPLAVCIGSLRVRAAIATEARRAETPQSGSVHEGAGPKDIAP